MEFMFERYVPLEDLPEIADWQIEQFFDRKEVKWVGKEMIKISDGRSFRVSYTTPKDKAVRIRKQIPVSVEWHKLTNWRNAKELAKEYPSLWESWKEKKAVPYWVVLRVEGNKYE